MMSFRSRLRSFFVSPSTRWYWLIVSLLLVYFGDSAIRADYPLKILQPFHKTVTTWNDELYLGLDNPGNILAGFILIFSGAILFSRTAILPSWMKSEPTLLQEPKAKSNLRSMIPWLAGNLVLFSLAMLQLMRKEYSILLVWVWLLTLLIPAILFWWNERGVLIHSITRVDWILMLALFAFALAVGSFLLNDLPAGWISDEGAFWRAARAIAVGEQKPVFFDFGVYSFPIASSLLQGWILRWAGIDMWGWRFASVVPAALTVFPLYLLAHELFDQRVAVIACILMIVNPYFITFARLGYNNSQSLFPVTLCIYFFVLGIRKNCYLFLWLSGIAAGFGFHTYFAAWLGLVVILLATLLLPFLSREKFRTAYSPFTVIFLGALAVILPRVLYGVSNGLSYFLHYKIFETSLTNGFYGRAVFGDERFNQAVVFLVGGQVDVFYDPVLYGFVLLRGLVRSIAGLFDPAGYADHYITYGIAGPGSSIFLVLGLGLVLANFRNFRNFILSIWFLAGFAFLGVLASLPPRPTHLVAIIPVMALLSAIGLISFFEALTPAREAAWKTARWLNGSISIVMILVCAMGLFGYFFMMPHTYYPDRAAYASWLGRQIDTPIDLILIDTRPIVDNIDNETDLKLTRHKIITLTRAELEKNPEQIKSWRNYVAFIGSGNTLEFAEWLANQATGASLKAGYVPIRQLRGYIVTDLEVNTSMELGIARGLKDLWNSPAGNILLACAAGIVLLSVLEVGKHITASHNAASSRNQKIHH